MYDPIRITGLSQFRRGLKAMDRNLPKQMRQSLNQASALVVDTAHPLVPVRTGRAAASLKVKSTQNQARVAGGSARAPHYPWLDFGGRVGRKNAVERAFYKHGRYLYKAYDEKHDEVLDILQAALIELARSAGVEVSEHGE